MVDRGVKITGIEIPGHCRFCGKGTAWQRFFDWDGTGDKYWDYVHHQCMQFSYFEQARQKGYHFLLLKGRSRRLSYLLPSRIKVKDPLEIFRDGYEAATASWIDGNTYFKQLAKYPIPIEEPFQIVEPPKAKPSNERFDMGYDEFREMFEKVEKAVPNKWEPTFYSIEAREAFHAALEAHIEHHQIKFKDEPKERSRSRIRDSKKGSSKFF